MRNRLLLQSWRWSYRNWTISMSRSATIKVVGFGCSELYLHKPANSKKTHGSVSVTNKLRSVHRKVAIVITGGLSTMASDVLDAHAYILPIDLLFCKRLFRAFLCICVPPKAHPLHPLVCKAVRRKTKRHLSPIHNLINFADINPRILKP